MGQREHEELLHKRAVAFCKRHGITWAAVEGDGPIENIHLTIYPAAGCPQLDVYRAEHLRPLWRRIVRRLEKRLEVS